MNNDGMHKGKYTVTHLVYTYLISSPVSRHARRNCWLWRDWSRCNLGMLPFILDAWGCTARLLSCSQLLNEYSEHEVHLYEADDRPGGHACTVRVAQKGKEPVEVDTYVDTSTI